MPSKPAPRLKPLPAAPMTARQRELRDAIASSPRAKFSSAGPFGVWLRTPDFGLLAQQLGTHCRYHTALPPRLSEFAILATAHWWRAQYEWSAHAPIAARAGVTPQTINDLRAGRRPARAPKDEGVIYDFVKELYGKRRVSNGTYARALAILGEAGVIELVGILGYYALIAMTLNVFRVPVPAGESSPFKEPARN